MNKFLDIKICGQVSTGKSIVLKFIKDKLEEIGFVITVDSQDSDLIEKYTGHLQTEILKALSKEITINLSEIQLNRSSIKQILFPEKSMVTVNGQKGWLNRNGNFYPEELIESMDIINPIPITSKINEIEKEINLNELRQRYWYSKTNEFLLKNNVEQIMLFTGKNDKQCLEFCCTAKDIDDLKASLVVKTSKDEEILCNVGDYIVKLTDGSFNILRSIRE